MYYGIRSIAGIFAVAFVVLNVYKDFIWRKGQAQDILDHRNHHSNQGASIVGVGGPDDVNVEIVPSEGGTTIGQGDDSSGILRSLTEEEQQLHQQLTTFFFDQVVTTSTTTTTSEQEETKQREREHEQEQEQEVPQEESSTSGSSSSPPPPSASPSNSPSSEPSKQPSNAPSITISSSSSSVSPEQKEHEQPNPASTSNSEGESGCLRHNSRTWLNASDTRIGNAQDILAKDQTEQDLQDSIINSPNLLTVQSGWTTATQSTICHHDSNLRHLDHLYGQQDRNIFAAIHYHQVRHAIPEAQARRQEDDCSTELRNHNINAYDYECPDAQHFVVNVGGPGLGANVKGGVNTALIAGLATNRVAHVLMNVPGRFDGLEGKPPPKAFVAQFHNPRKYPFVGWDLANCPRRDYQCVFQPLSPCVLTRDDFLNAHILNKTEHNMVRNNGKLPDYLNETKVVIYQNNFATLPKTPPKAQQVLQNYITTVLDPKSPPLNLATRGLPFSGRKIDPLSRVATVYSLRLLPKSQQQVREMVESLGAPLHNAVPSATIGLPIRASDKCNMESECLTYQEHLQAATDFWQGHNNQQQQQQRALTTATDANNNDNSNTTVSMIVTTESLQIRQQHDNFTTMTAHANHPLRQKYSFLSNTFEEEPPDGGNANPFKSQQLDADRLMIGSLASLHLQMHATFFVANTCSNYHLLLMDLALSSCSASASGQEVPPFQFLQQSTNPWFRVCCWIKGPGVNCVKERQKHRPTNLTSTY